MASCTIFQRSCFCSKKIKGRAKALEQNMDRQSNEHYDPIQSRRCVRDMLALMHHMNIRATEARTCLLWALAIVEDRLIDSNDAPDPTQIVQPWGKYEDL